MKLTAPFVAVSVVALAVFGYFLAQPGGPARGLFGPKKLVMATIYLTPYEPTPGTRACAATTVPYTLRLEKNDDVEWSVVDFCGITMNYTLDTEVTKWSAASGSTGTCGGSYEPVEDVKKNKRNYKAKVKGNCDTGARFKYEIWVDGKKIGDPELEIA